VASGFLSDASQTAIREAVRAIEQRSAAEIVVSVRRRSGSYLHADLLVGVAAALAALAFMLFSPHPFDLIWFLFDPLIVGVGLGLLLPRITPLRRLLTGRDHRQARVRIAADALFFEKGVHHTRDRTGVLVYVSLLERRVQVLGDSGVDQLVPRREWHTAAAALQAALDAGGDGAALARAMGILADVLAQHVPRQADDANELADEVDR
jgi:putative membrane protein